MTPKPAASRAGCGPSRAAASADQLRKRYVRREPHHVDAAMTQIQEEIESSREHTPALDSLWDRQWRTHMMDAAMARIRQSVKPSHFQLFELTVLKACPLADVAKSLGISIPMAYVIRHRIGKLLKKEVQRLQEQHG
jgi:hypothetical protein